MDYQTGFFYLFAAVLLFAAFRVITARNPVHAVLFLMLAFSQAAALWLLLKAEFLGITLVLVYLGAVMVLFLFVVMMLDINITVIREGFLKYLPVGLLVGGILLAELVVLFGGWTASDEAAGLRAAPTPDPAQVSNIEALGNILYTDYVYLFQAAGLVLLVAMIGAIVLTLRRRPGVRKQKISEQVNRSAKDTVTLVQAPSGKGLSS
jgi:NADH-quinone oxidoreductase subunit J